MKIFLSWSGARSKAVAEYLADWLQCVVQAAKPWVSVRDIDRGALWSHEIGEQLKDTSIGVVCLTAENKDKPWILFESGALAKGIASNRVCTLLIDLEPTDVDGPLAQFNHTVPTKEGILKLVLSINRTFGADIQLRDDIVAKVFETNWPDFESQFALILKEHPAGKKPKPRDEKDVLLEILNTVRGINHRVTRLEDLSDAPSRLSKLDANVKRNSLADLVMRADKEAREKLLSEFMVKRNLVKDDSDGTE